MATYGPPRHAAGSGISPGEGEWNDQHVFATGNERRRSEYAPRKPQKKMASYEDLYRDEYVEEAERAVRAPPDPRLQPGYRPASAQPKKKPLLTEKQQEAVFDGLFGSMSKQAQMAFEMAQSDVGQKVAVAAGLGVAAVVLPFVPSFIAGIRR